MIVGQYSRCRSTRSSRGSGAVRATIDRLLLLKMLDPNIEDCYDHQGLL